jgi:hypothetical protein
MGTKEMSLRRGLKGWQRDGELVDSERVIADCVRTIQGLKKRIKELEIRLSDYEHKTSLCRSCGNWIECSDVKFGVCSDCHLENEDSLEIAEEYELERRSKEFLWPIEKVQFMIQLAHWYERRMWKINLHQGAPKDRWLYNGFENMIQVVLDYAEESWDKADPYQKGELKDLSGVEIVMEKSMWRFDKESRKWIDRRTKL